MSLLDLDFDAKKRLGYKHPKSRVYLDGREVLHSYDWTKRKKELALRSGRRCEVVYTASWGWSGENRRCSNEADHAHHAVLRSQLRDDRLSKLLHICEWCHARIDQQQREAIRSRNRREHEELRGIA